jgi:hypothetical protein
MTRDTPPTPPIPAAELPDALRWQLRALRADAIPARDLWAGIAPRLEARATPRVPASTPWLALAASLLLVAGVAGVWAMARADADPSRAALVEAGRLSTDYRRTLDALPVDPAAASALKPAIDELDRSAGQIRRALARDPDSRLLLQQLRRTYARRLELSQRALVG